MVTKQVTLIIALLALLVGIYIGLARDSVIASIDVTLEEKQLIYFHAYAKQSHQYYIDYPEEQNASTGDTNFNLWAIEMYQRTLEYITGGQVITGLKSNIE